MKKLHYIILSFISLFLYYSCDDIGDNMALEGDSIIEDFPFTFEVTAPESMFWKSLHNMQLELHNEHQVDGQTFEVTWELYNKEGKLLYQNEDVSSLNIEQGITDIGYIPLDKGLYSMTFYCKNGNPDYDVPQVVEFEVINRPYSFSVTADRYTFYQSENEPIKILLTISEADWVTYQYSYSSPEENQITTTSGDIIEENKQYSLIENETVTLLFDPLGNDGKHTLYVTSYDTQGQKITEPIVFEVKSIEVKLDLDYKEESDKEIFYTQTANLTANIDAVFDNPNNPNMYNATAIIEGANGFIKIGNKQYKHGDTMELEKGVTSFSFFSLSNENTTAKVGFEITDQFGNKDDNTLDIKVKAIDYTTTLTSDIKEEGIFYVDSTNLNLNIKAAFDGIGELTPTYEATLSILESNGYIQIGEEQYENGDTFKVNKGITRYTYHPKENKDKDTPITFDIIDSYGLKKSASITIKVKSIGFKTEIETDKQELYFTENTKGWFTVIPDNKSARSLEPATPPTYKAKLKLNEIEDYIQIGEKQYQNGDTFDIESGKTDFVYFAQTNKDYTSTIEFNIIDSYGLEKPISTSIKVKSIGYKPEIEIEKEELYFTQNTKGSFTVTPDNKSARSLEPATPPTYKATLKLNEISDYITIGSNQYKSGDTFDIKSGKTDFVYFAETSKDYTSNIEFTIVDSYGLKKTISTNVKVNIIDFNFELSKLEDEIFFNQSANLHLNFENELNSNHPKKPIYTVTYTVTGGDGVINFSGNTYKDGDTFNILSPSNVDFTYAPTEYQNTSNAVKLRIEDQYGTVHEKSISISIKQLTFDFAALESDDFLYLSDPNSLGTITGTITVTEGSTEGMSYFVRPKTNGDGVFFYQGKQYPNNALIPLNSTTFEIKYKANSYNNGSHTITLTASDNTGQNKAQNVKFDIYKSPVPNKLSLTRSGLEKNSCGWDNDCKWRSRYFISYDISLNDSNGHIQEIIISGLSQITQRVETKSFTFFNQPLKQDDYQYWEENHGDPKLTWKEGTQMTVTIIDNNGKRTIENTVLTLK